MIASPVPTLSANLTYRFRTFPQRSPSSRNHPFGTPWRVDRVENDRAGRFLLCQLRPSDVLSIRLEGNRLKVQCSVSQFDPPDMDWLEKRGRSR